MRARWLLLAVALSIALVSVFALNVAPPSCVDRAEADRLLRVALASHEESFHQADPRVEADALHETAIGLERLAEALRAEPEAADLVSEGASHYEAAARLVDGSVREGTNVDGEIYARSVHERTNAHESLEGLLEIADDLNYCSS
jgi:hypothetical protein